MFRLHGCEADTIKAAIRHIHTTNVREDDVGATKNDLKMMMAEMMMMVTTGSWS